MSLSMVGCIVSFVPFLVFYVLYFEFKGKEGPWGRIFLGLFLAFAASTQAFLFLEGRSLFAEEASVQANWIGILLGIFMSSCFYYPFAKKSGKKFQIADISLFFLSGCAFLADAISISYALLTAQ